MLIPTDTNVDFTITHFGLISESHVSQSKDGEN